VEPDELAEFEPMWTSEARYYYLLRSDTGYLPIYLGGEEEMMVVIDENDDLANAVVAKMIEAGVPIIEPPLRPVPSKPDPVQERYPKLSHFFGAYFHEDWNLDAASDLEVVRRFKRETAAAGLERVRRELSAFLAEPLDEVALDDVLVRSLGCYYDPTPAMTNRDWLHRIMTYLADD
jgi:hypothetical protein